MIGSKQQKRRRLRNAFLTLGLSFSCLYRKQSRESQTSQNMVQNLKQVLCDLASLNWVSHRAPNEFPFCDSGFAHATHWRYERLKEKNAWMLKALRSPTCVESPE